MKLKFLSLFFALGIFAVGTSVMATQSKAPEGATVNVAEEGVAVGGVICPDDDANIKLWDNVLNKGICNVLKLDSNIADACKELCDDANKMSTVVPTKENVIKCAAAIKKDESDKDSKIASTIKSAVNTTVTLGCKALCSGETCKTIFGKKICGGCNTCKGPKTRELCGTLCCNFGAGDNVSNCLSSQDPKDACTNYTPK